MPKLKINKSHFLMVLGFILFIISCNSKKAMPLKKEQAVLDFVANLSPIKIQEAFTDYDENSIKTSLTMLLEKTSKRIRIRYSMLARYPCVYTIVHHDDSSCVFHLHQGAKISRKKFYSKKRIKNLSTQGFSGFSYPDYSTTGLILDIDFFDKQHPDSIECKFYNLVDSSFIGSTKGVIFLQASNSKN